MQVKTFEKEGVGSVRAVMRDGEPYVCLLYTSDAADE